MISFPSIATSSKLGNWSDYFSLLCLTVVDAQFNNPSTLDIVYLLSMAKLEEYTMSPVISAVLVHA